MLEIPSQVPELGFYHHYKHDSEKGIRNYAYEVTGISFHTESKKVFVNYRPLYEEAAVYQASLKLGLPCTDAREIEMWMENVTKNNRTFPRFKKITDPNLIAELEKVRARMYPTE